MEQKVGRKLPRRDRCHLVGKRAGKLTSAEANLAWVHLSAQLDNMQRRDMPKFEDVLGAIRSATIYAKNNAIPS